jgi:hypothetical protein
MAGNVWVSVLLEGRRESKEVVSRGERVSEVGGGSSLVCVCPRVQSHRLPHQMDVQAGKNWTIASPIGRSRDAGSNGSLSAPTLGRHRRAINCPYIHRRSDVRHQLYHIHQSRCILSRCWEQCHVPSLQLRQLIDEGNQSQLIRAQFNTHCWRDDSMAKIGQGNDNVCPWWRLDAHHG